MISGCLQLIALFASERIFKIWSVFRMMILLCVCVWSTDLRKRLDRATYCLHVPKFEAYFDRRHLGESTLRTKALDLRSEDYESKTYKPLVENPCCYPSHRCFIDTFINWGLTAERFHQDGRSRFLAFKNETTEARSSLFLGLLSIVSCIDRFHVTSSLSKIKN